MDESTSSGASTKSRIALLAFAALASVLVVFLVVRSKPRAGASPHAVQANWLSDLSAATEQAQESGRPLHVSFSRPDVPLAARLEETLAAPPVRQLAGMGYINVRLDSRTEQASFKRWLGGAGALGSAIVDVGPAGEQDVLAALPGYADVDRYVAFLDGTARSLKRLRQLRGHDSGPARLELGELYAAQGSLARARSCFERATEPGSTGAALEHLARLDAEAGATAEARSKLERARAQGASSGSQRWLLTEALVLSSERHVSEAISVLEVGAPALPQGAERTRAWLLLGTLEHELKRDVPALAHLELARSESPGTPLSRAANEQIFHIEHPEPGHTH